MSPTQPSPGPDITRALPAAMGDDHFVDRLSTARGRPADSPPANLRAAGRGQVCWEARADRLQSWQRLAGSQGRGRGAQGRGALHRSGGLLRLGVAVRDDLAIALLRQVAEAIEPPILTRRGEVVKRLGDGLMAAFWDASSAVEAAFEMRARIYSIELGGYRPRLKTGVHLGRPRKIGGDYFGVDVNIAARLAEAAQPDEVLISDRTLQALDAATLTTAKRRLRAKGTPADLVAHAVGLSVHE